MSMKYDLPINNHNNHPTFIYTDEDTNNSKNTIEMNESNKQDQNKCGFFKACYNIIALMIGIGMLSLPKVFTQTGWIMGVISIFLESSLSLYCGVLLQRCIIEGNLKENNQNISLIETYPELGRKAAGVFGCIMASIGSCGTSVGSAILFLVLAIDQFEILFGPHVFHQYIWGLIYIAVIIPFAYIKTLNHVAIIAFFGTVASLIMFIIVIIISFYDLGTGKVTIENGYNNTETDLLPRSIGEMAEGYVTLSFSFTGACIFPEVVRVMKHPYHFQYALTTSVMLATFIYLCISCVTYGVYGRYINTQPSIVNVLPNNWSTKIICVMILIHLFSGFLILLNPVFRNLESLFKIENNQNFPISRKKEYIGRFIIRTLLITICFIVAITIPFFTNIICFIGSTTVTLCTYVCPCWFYIALFWPPSWTPNCYREWKKSKKSKKSKKNYKENKSQAIIKDNFSNSSKTYNKDKDKIDNKKLDDLCNIEFVNVGLDSINENTTNKISRREITKLEFIVISIIGVFSALIGVVGCIQSISGIIISIKNAKYFQ